MLTYKRLDQLEIIDYFDYNFVGCQDSRKSTLGYIYLLTGGAISWKSVKQTLIASSTMEVEFIAHIGTNSMVTDPLTKGIPPKVFHEHTTHMGVKFLEEMLF